MNPWPSCARTQGVLGRLRRREAPNQRDAPVSGCRFAVVDFETTGLFARAHDRVIEVAVVHADGCERAIVDEWTTLVNPGRDLGPTALHGIWGRDLADAPTFPTIAGDLLARLEGAVLAAHNVRFERDFLAAEYERLGLALPLSPSLCTMHLAGRFSSARGRRLAHCCADLGIEAADEHAALADARAAALLLLHCLANAERDGLATLRGLGCATAFPEASAWPRLHVSGRALRRPPSSAPPSERSYLAHLVERLGEDEGGGLGDEARDYLEVLDRALEDRHVSAEESDALFTLARQWGISRDEADELHDRHLRGLVSAALADRVVTEPERRDLELVADLLAIDRVTLAQMLSDGSGNEQAPVATSRDDLRGKSVCFTGAMTTSIGGVPITRERAEQLASEAGLVTCPSVTKKLDILVVADPDSLSGKARKARAYGTRIIAEPAFWRALGVDVD